mgnify:CR=1 FL=1
MVAYAPIESAVGSNGMITVTTTVLTTSTISNSTTTVYNQTVTGTMCPGGATSCAGTSEHMEVIVNRPVIPGLYIFTIPVYWSRLTGTWFGAYFSFYHSLAYGAITIVVATWTTLGILGERRKENMNVQKARRIQ